MSVFIDATAEKQKSKKRNPFSINGNIGELDYEHDRNKFL